MSDHDDVELGQIGTLGIVCVLIAFLLVLLSGCAHPPKNPPPLWDICRDSCASRGAIAAAVIGPVDPGQHPKCACGMKDEGT